MTEHKFTDEEIIKALELCFAPKGTAETCAKCSYHKFGKLCKVKRDKDALDLINRQKAEIEGLREKQTENEKLLNDRVIESVNAVSKAHLKYENALEEQIKTIKAEAVKEFAEMLKKYYRHIDKTAGALIEYTIDAQVKEFLGGVSGAADSQDNA